MLPSNAKHNTPYALHEFWDYLRILSICPSHAIVCGCMGVGWRIITICNIGIVVLQISMMDIISAAVICKAEGTMMALCRSCELKEWFLVVVMVVSKDPRSHEQAPKGQQHATEKIIQRKYGMGLSTKVAPWQTLFFVIINRLASSGQRLRKGVRRAHVTKSNMWLSDVKD
jgi:hypothetical protein